MKHPDLGKTGTDKITGFKGLIVGHSNHITGCDQFHIQPECDSNSLDKFLEGHWFDAGRVEISDEIVITIGEVSGEEPGADIPSPSDSKM